VSAPLPDRALLATIELVVVLSIGSAAAILLGVTGLLLTLALLSQAWQLAAFTLLFFGLTVWAEIALCRWYAHWLWLICIELTAAGVWLIWLSHQPFNLLEKL
jgi:hypothetical protein